MKNIIDNKGQKKKTKKKVEKQLVLVTLKREDKLK
jgi:hypothetical protein